MATDRFSIADLFKVCENDPDLKGFLDVTIRSAVLEVCMAATGNLARREGRTEAMIQGKIEPERIQAHKDFEFRREKLYALLAEKHLDFHRFSAQEIRQHYHNNRVKKPPAT